MYNGFMIYRLIYTLGKVRGHFTIEAGSPEEATSRLRTYLASSLAYRDLIQSMIPHEVQSYEEAFSTQESH